jgi:hypothetical protein
LEFYEYYEDETGAYARQHGGEWIDITDRQHANCRGSVEPFTDNEDEDLLDDGPMHVCDECGSPLVHPVEWEEQGAGWWVMLRCPNCEATYSGTFTHDAVEHFDEELDRGTDDLVRDLKRLMSHNIEEEIERFSNALEADGILPEDFGRPR